MECRTPRTSLAEVAVAQALYTRQSYLKSEIGVEPMSCVHTLTTVLPYSDLDGSEAFYVKLGFTRQGRANNYRMQEAH